MPITVSVGRSALLRASTTLTCALASIVTIDEARADHVVVTWSVPAVHFLDDDMLPVSSFPTAAEQPNGVATDGVLIYCAAPYDAVVTVYDFAGVEQFQFDLISPSGSGVELVGDELAAADDNTIDFYDRVTGAYIRTIPAPSFDYSAEGLGFDGEVLWLVGEPTIYGIDPADGAPVTSLPNPATGCMYAGTGVAASADGELTVVCETGEWFVISSDDGAVLDSGNNGLDMYGSDYFSPPPECGNGIVEDGEDCDEFGLLSSQCDIDCTFIACGDGVIAPLADEECDDGNLEDGDGCSATCTAELPATTDGGGTADSTDSGGVSTEGDTSSGGESSSDGSTSIAGTLGESSGPAVDESDSTAASEADGGGCGCTSGANDSLPKLLPLGVLALLRRRRARVR